MADAVLEALEIVDTDAVPAAVIRLSIPRDRMQSEFPAAVHEIIDALAAQGMQPAGPPFARHYRLDPNVFDFDVGFPVEGEFAVSGRVASGALPPARVVRTVYRGGYEGLPDAWSAFSSRIREAGLSTRAGFRERYLVGPEAGGDSSRYRTELAWEID